MSSDAFKLMFREYDIRGRVNDEELNEKNVGLVIRGFASFLSKRGINRVVVGYDNRSYSPLFHKAAIESLMSSGFEVIDIGLALSPVAYFAQYHFESPGVVMITASHNPDGWSGFKLGHGYSKTIGPDEIKEVYNIIENEDFCQEKKGIYRKESVRDAYIDAVVSRIKINPEYKPRIVIDAGNGGAGIFAYEIFERLGCTTFQLNCDPDTSYPHYFPNPSDLKARKKLAEMVTHPYIHADVGIAFDGDGDRIGVLAENGENIWSDKILMILAKDLLTKKKGAKIVFDVKCSQALEEVISANGGIPIMWITGHSYVKSKMHEVNADIAGERSGHIFIGGEQYFGFDDALFTAAKLVEYMSYVKKPLMVVLEEFPKYITSPEIKTHCGDGVKYGIVDKLVKEFKAEYGDKVIDINGARVMFEDGWGLVRASSNLPELVMIFEAKTMDRLKEIRSIFKAKMDKYPEIKKEWENDIQ